MTCDLFAIQCRQHMPICLFSVYSFVLVLHSTYEHNFCTITLSCKNHQNYLGEMSIFQEEDDMTSVLKVRGFVPMMLPTLFGKSRTSLSETTSVTRCCISPLSVISRLSSRPCTVASVGLIPMLMNTFQLQSGTLNTTTKGPNIQRLSRTSPLQPFAQLCKSHKWCEETCPHEAHPRFNPDDPIASYHAMDQYLWFHMGTYTLPLAYIVHSFANVKGEELLLPDIDANFHPWPSLWDEMV